MQVLRLLWHDLTMDYVKHNKVGFEFGAENALSISERVVVS